MSDGKKNSTRFKEIQEKEKDAYINDWQKEKTKDEVVRWLEDNLDFNFVLDLGCGAIRYPFKDVLRVDGNVDANPDVLSDLAQPLFGIVMVLVDLVFSIEVAEHIEPEKADNFADNLALSRKWIVMTTCPPHEKHSPYEQKAHLNEKEKSYWIEKMEKRGFAFQEDLTNKMQEHFKGVPNAMRWFKKDVMIFKCAQ